MTTSANDIYQIQATPVSLLSGQEMIVSKHDSINSSLTITFIKPLCLFMTSDKK